MNSETQGFRQRSRLDIMACILVHSNAGSRKTRLIYRCNLSVAQFNKYVVCLLEGKLLEKQEKDGRAIFFTTEKGREFLQDFERIREVLDQMRL